MKLIPVLYYGFTGMDSRFSTPMLPWIVSEIRKRDYCEKLSLGVEYGILQAYNPDFELQFSHRILQMIRFSQADLDPSTFLYLLKDDAEKTLYCYMYQAPSVAEVAELYKQMKDQSTLTPSRTTSSAANLTSLCVDISPSLSNFFEVLYIGKIKVWNKKVPDTFIDDALEKFKAYELEKKHKAKLLGNIGRLRSEDNIRRGSSSDSISSNDSYTTHQRPHLQRSLSTSSNLVARTSDIQLADQAEISKALRVERVKSIEEHTNENQAQPVDDEKDEEASPKTAVPENIDDHNRTMVLQIDRTDLRLISPDRKVILLHKHHKDVAACVQGQLNGEHFGFVSKETSNTQNYIGYIFKCESPNIANDAVAAINQAFSSAETRPKPMITSCDHCPMIWFHRLCTEIEHLSDRKTQAAILRRIEQLDDEEQTIIMTKFRGAETNSMIEQNEFLMMLLRAHCESKQSRHAHDTAENRSEFLNQYLGGGTIFMKAKRSLSNSFEMLKKRASRDDFSSTLKEMNLPLTHSLNRETSPHSPTMSVNNDQSDKESEGMRSRSSTIGSQSDLHLSVRDNTNKSSVSPDRISMGSEKMPKSPMMDIFMKVGSPKSNSAEEGTTAKTEAGSWRHAIFKKVLTPNKLEEDLARKRTNDELKDLWKKSIHQAVLLVRMEKENARLKAKQEESAVKRIKLEYDEMKPSQRAVMEVWDLITSKSNTRVKTDRPMLLEAVKQGVPRGKRGEVWQFLAEQYSMTIPPVDTEKYPNYNVPYETLLKQLTAHQHAILIDLGRTFPSHSYFSSPLGPGQLALFNLLKAYSLLDPEVGYCQGVSFIVGVLLLHMEESQAFYLLTHLMFRRGLRKQYLPDMTGLQVRLYQLSRLLHDKLPDLYEHFNDYDIAPTLYAAPWLLTIFASQFPLGFVTRVFDLVFLEGVDVVFRVALSMLVYHKDKLMACDGFEEIMNYLKNTVTTIDKPVLEKIMKFVYVNDISKQLEEYRVEYQVLQEEMIAVQPQVESVHRLEQSNKRLTDQNKALTLQLELALTNVQRLEKHRTLQQSQVNKLEMHTRGLEVTIATMGNFINNLVETKANVEIPDEVRRIISQITFSERRKTELKGQNNLMKMFQTPTPVHPNRLMVKSLSTGKIQLDTITDQNELRSNSLNAHTKPKLTFDETVAIRKNSQFFSNTHNNILQQNKVHNNSTTYTGSNAKIDITIQEFENELNTKNNNMPSSPISINNIMSPIDDLKISPTNSVDSGVISPSSPKNLDNHPLSNCDVNFTFNGTKELKTIKSLKSLSRNSSPELLRK